MRKKVAVIFSFLLLLSVIGLYFPSVSYACSCAEPPSVQEEFQQKTAIFSGKVIKISENGNNLFKSSADPVSVVFEVTNSWKGATQSKILINTAISSASCGYKFNLDTEYLVYAYGEENNLETNICNRTKPVSAAAGDLIILGKGEIPAQNGQQPIKHVELVKNYNIWIIVFSLLLLSFAYLLLRKFKRRKKG